MLSPYRTLTMPPANRSAVRRSAPHRFAAPRRNIFCVGKNYREHAHEFAQSVFDSSAVSGAVPETPINFSKVPACVIGPGDEIVFDPAGLFHLRIT